ncbi:MAG: hypothetical protein R3B47_10765 [Bacteroidia bacterium]
MERAFDALRNEPDYPKINYNRALATGNIGLNYRAMGKADIADRYLHQAESWFLKAPVDKQWELGINYLISADYANINDDTVSYHIFLAKAEKYLAGNAYCPAEFKMMFYKLKTRKATQEGNWEEGENYALKTISTALYEHISTRDYFNNPSLEKSKRSFYCTPRPWYPRSVLPL